MFCVTCMCFLFSTHSCADAKIPSSQELMFAGNTHGQMHVTHDGTLTIQVRR